MHRYNVQGLIIFFLGLIILFICPYKAPFIINIFSIFLMFIGLLLFTVKAIPISKELFQTAIVMLTLINVLFIGFIELECEAKVYIKGVVSGETIEAVMAALECYPKYYAKKFFYEGAYVLICDDNNYPDIDNTYAYLSYDIKNNKALSITIRDLDSAQTFLSMYHELGHYYDYNLRIISDTDEWYEIFEEYKHQYPDGTGYNQKEFFADQYVIYVMNQYDLLKDSYQIKSPEAQKYIAKIIENDILYKL